MSDYNFQAGQEVVLLHYNFGKRSIKGIFPVERTTSTLAVVRTLKFRRNTGRVYGGSGAGFSYHFIEPATPELREEFAEQQRLERRRTFLRKYLDGNWEAMGEENLDKVAKALGLES